MEIFEKIKGFQPVSLCDWPGKVACVIFLGGCNFRCPTCHNKKIAFYPEKVPSIEIDSIFSYLQKKKNWLDGVVISGGEPTIAQDLDILIKEVRKLGFSVKLDTNGSHPEVISRLLDGKLVELFAVDVKGPFEKYGELTGTKIATQKVKENFEWIFKLAQENPSRFLFRLTKVPILTKKDIEIAKTYLPGGFNLNLQEYLDVT
ncbi:anaerobic ribonucleoside-triphosphate reductase activating protein [Desulfothermus okinawensis JCM 13304]